MRVARIDIVGMGATAIITGDNGTVHALCMQPDTGLRATFDAPYDSPQKMRSLAYQLLGCVDATPPSAADIKTFLDLLEQVARRPEDR